MANPKDYFANQTAASNYGEAADPDRQTFIDPLHTAGKLSDDVRERAMLLAARLIGNSPVSNETNGPKPVPNGIFGEINDIASIVTSNLADIKAALDRIERSLP